MRKRLFHTHALTHTQDNGCRDSVSGRERERERERERRQEMEMSLYYKRKGLQRVG